MEIQKHQIKLLEASLKSRGKKLRLIPMFASMWKFYLVFITYIGTSTYLLWSADHGKYSLFFIGIAIGVIFKDFVYARLRHVNWELTQHVTDWEKVNEIVKSKT